MSTNQRVLRESTAHPRVALPKFGRVAGFAVAPLRLASRLLLGSGHGPRGYRREGFPEHEMHQVISGHIDRFRGL